VTIRHLACSGALALALAACGGGQTRLNVFSTEWQDDGGKSIAALQSRLAGVVIPPGADVAVGVVDDGLVGAPLGGGTPWKLAHALDSRPVLAGTVVVGTGGGELFALDATNGKTLWTRRAGGALRGAGDDGRSTIVSLGTTGETQTTVLVIARSGAIVRQLEAGPPIGTPAIVGPYAFLPWQNQYVTVYDISSGEEVARVVLREQTSRAFTVGKALFFGELGLFRFDDQIAHASSGHASHVGLPVRELPGTPKWFEPGTEVLPVAADARDKIRLYARPTTTGELGIDSGRFVATYFKIALGMDAKTGQLAWVHTHPSDIVGGASYAGGTALCDADGKVTFVDQKTGGTAGSLSLGQKVKACAVQADGLTKPAAASPKSLAEQVADAVVAKDPEMAMIQKMLLRELAGLDDEVVTKALIDLASDPSTSPVLLPDARSALAARRNGAQFMIDALGRHYDYLKDVLRPPPVGPIADALGGMKAKRAAAALASHLSDPADSSDDVKRVAAALVQVGDKDQLAALEAFFALYRATADDDDLVSAVASAAQAIVKLGGDDGKAFVANGIKDASTVPQVRAKVTASIEGLDAAGNGGDDAKTPGDAAKAAGTGKKPKK
jgi:outer membrane protein assembly factor BamB